MHNFSWNQISFSKGLVEVDGILHPKVGIDEDLEKLLAEDPGLYLDSRPAANAVAGLVTDYIIFCWLFIGSNTQSGFAL